MRKILVLLSLGLVALTGCKKDSSSLEESLIVNPVIPEGSFAPGESVTIQGTGFTAADEIWFRAQTKADGDIQAEVTNQTGNELTFTVPQVSVGEHAVILKRGEREMVLGKLAVSEAAATKLYAIGSPDDSDTQILWEIDKTTGELTEIMQLPASDEEWYESPVVDPANGNIYLYKFDRDDVFDLYCINPANKMLEKIGRLKEGNEDTFYYLCMIDNQLHALIEKENIEDEEIFYSLVSINPNTAVQTTVADFGSLHQALNIPLSVFAGLDGAGKFFYYDMVTKSLIVPIFKDVEEGDCWQLTRFDIANQKIIPRDGTNEGCISLFVKDSKVCGAFYNEDQNHVDFRAIDTENLTAGESLGSASTGSDDKFFRETWVYDTATGKGYTATYFEDSSDAYSAFGAFDFNTKEFKEIKKYTNGIELWTIFK